MKSEFRILWFEDNLQWQNMMVEKSISGYLEKRCLTLKVKEGDIENHQFINELSNSSYELVLMDYQLSGDSSKPHGNNIIKQIRLNQVTTDVLFYSTDYANMINSAVESKLDGVYFSRRKDDDFIQKLFSVIDKIIAQSENIVNLRGFVLDSCSHYETEFKSQIQKCISHLPEERCVSFIDYIKALFDASIKKKQEKWEEAETKSAHIREDANQNDTAALSQVYKKSEKELLIDMQMRTQILKYCYCEELLGDRYSEKDENKVVSLCEYYQDKICVYRNRLAHVEEGQDSIKIKGEDIPLNRELHEQLRSSISEFGDMWDDCFPMGSE